MSEIPRHFGWCGKPGEAALPPPSDNPCTDTDPPALMTCPVCHQGDGMPDLISPCGRCLNKALRVLYTNYRGETRWRSVIPLNRPPEFGDTPHHKNQWTVRVWDMEKCAVRSYALLDCHCWEPLYPGDCLKPREALFYAFNRLPSVHWNKADEHLKICARCRGRVAAVSQVAQVQVHLPTRSYEGGAGV